MIVVLDWDYDNFDFDEEGRLHYYEDVQGEEVWVEGWPAPGVRLVPTLYRRIPGEMYGFEKA